LLSGWQPFSTTLDNPASASSQGASAIPDFEQTLIIERYHMDNKYFSRDAILNTAVICLFYRRVFMIFSKIKVYYSFLVIGDITSL
jgi:hypothetical protein